MPGLSARIADSLIESRIIKEEDRGLYEYGIRQFCFATLNLVTEICIGIMCGMLKECIAFLIAYIPLRRFAGGLHAKSELRCYGLSTLVFGAGLAFIRIGRTMWPTIILPVLFFAACGIVASAAPVDSSAKPLDEVEHKVFRKRTQCILVVHIILFVLAFILSWDIAVILVVADAMLSVMLISGIIKNKFSVR